MRIRVEDSVAIVIDFQEKLVPVMVEKDELIHNAQILLTGLKELEVPMYVTQQYTKGLGETVEALQPFIEEMPIEKIRFSAINEIKQYLGEKKYVIVCGIEAHICVLQTVIDLAQSGYTPVLVVDCISSRKDKNLQYAIERAKQEGAILTTFEAILFELLEVAGNETSKKIQRLIR